jgi:hypothetical protein
MANIALRKLESQGNISKIFSLRQEDATPERFSMLFRLEKRKHISNNRKQIKCSSN